MLSGAKHPDCSFADCCKAAASLAQNEIRRSLCESRGYDPHAARDGLAAIARLTGRHEMIVAARDKNKLEAARENRKLKRRQQLAFVA